MKQRPGRRKELTSGKQEERARLLEEIAAWEIRLVARALPEETSSLLEHDLTLQQARVFGFILANGSVAIGSVAEALCIKPNVATGIVQRLVERGLVERREDPQDRRIRLLSVSERGQVLVDELRRIVLAKSREYLDRLNDDQLRQLRDIFASMGGA